MAGGDERVNAARLAPRLAPGLAAAALAVALAGGAIWAVAAEAGGLGLPALLGDTYVRGVTLFTLKQAALSTLLSALLGLAAARAVQRKIKEQDLLANGRRMGDRLDAALRERFGDHPHVGDIRGRGLFRALELVADRATKEPFDASRQLHARIKHNAMEAGLLCYPMGGVIDGARGDNVLLAPPYIIDGGHIDEMVEKLSLAIEASLASAP